jgi:hypothetical protein
MKWIAIQTLEKFKQTNAVPRCGAQWRAMFDSMPGGLLSGLASVGVMPGPGLQLTEVWRRLVRSTYYMTR